MKYINFTRTASPYTRFTRGNPVHDGEIPAGAVTVGGIRVDGEPVELADCSIPENLHRSLFEMRRLGQRNFHMDCLSFAALMRGMVIDRCRRDGLIRFILEMEDVAVSPDDRSIDSVVAVGVLQPGGKPRAKHVVVPAHTPAEAQYIQKLGYDWPVCLSGLASAMEMYRCHIARPVTHLEVSRNQE